MDKKTKLKKLVIKTYSSIASQGKSCCMPSSCCVSPTDITVSLLYAGRLLGYSEEELKIGLGEANRGLGCGNPLAIAELREGETVLDLGSGAGFDALLCSMRVGNDGHIIGIDMTPEMVTKAKENAQKLTMFFRSQPYRYYHYISISSVSGFCAILSFLFFCPESVM